MQTSLLNRSRLLRLAGSASFHRGEEYFRQERITLTEQANDAFEGRARGTEIYRLWVSGIGSELQWSCSCPAAAHGEFCKHLVAASLCWLKPRSEPSDDRPPVRSLASRLHGLDRASLVALLTEAVAEDPALERKLFSRLADSVEEIRDALDSVLDIDGFLDWRESTAFANELNEPLERLGRLLETRPEACFDLAEHVLDRLLDIYPDSDDSGGAIGMAVRDFAELHRIAARDAGIGGKRLAKSLYMLQCKDDWMLFPLSNYWHLFGAEGRADYESRVDHDYRALGPSQSKRTVDAVRDGSFHVLERRRELAEMQQDFHTQEAILSRELSYPQDYIWLVELCLDFGQERRAAYWAERGLRQHFESPKMLVFCAGLLQRAGFIGHAVGLLWPAFLLRRDFEQWQALKDATGDQWPAWRRRALDAVAAREPTTPDGKPDATRRIALLLHDGEVDAARQLANVTLVQRDVLERLGKKIARTHPRDAAGFLRRSIDRGLVRANASSYADFIPVMRLAAEVDPTRHTRDWLRDLRVRYKRRRKLMGLMDKAGL